jgi:hypothetical protein
VNRGCFYDQLPATRTATIDAYFCPSQQHDQRVTTGPDPQDGHTGHPRNDPATGQPWLGAIADYRAVLGSSCSVFNEAGAQVTNFDGGQGHYADGPIPQCDRTYVREGGASGRGVLSFKAVTSLKHITDGTSQTALGGEVGRATSESGHAFNGDHFPGVQLGHNPSHDFCQKPELPKTEGGDSGFGSVHSGVVLFVMCDGSVQAIAKEIDVGMLDRLATRAGDDLFDPTGSAVPYCN